MVRVTIGGLTPLHGEMNRRREALREEVRGIALAISERLWVEKLVLRTMPPALLASADPTLRDELARLLAQAAADAGFVAALDAELADFLARTPPDLGAPEGEPAGEGGDELLAAVRRGDVATLIRDAASALDARLAAVA